MSLSLRMLCRRGPREVFGMSCQPRPLVQPPRCAPSCERLARRHFNSTANTRSGPDTAPSGSSLKSYYVTTPIFYVNADPHIGHLYSDVIADVLVRYHGYMNSGYSAYDRKGHAVSADTEALQVRVAQQSPVSPVFSTGTDEHGLKVQKVAEAAGEDPRALCDRISQRFRHLADAANVDFSTFIRTTDADHTVAVEHLWRTLRERGHIYQGSHEGWYAVSDEAFYPETQVRKVTVDGQEQMQSIETGAKVEWSQEVNYKFRLSAFQQPLIDWLRANPTAIQPAQRHAQVLQEIESGLADLSISRPRSRLTWGIPVPDDADHTIYVWVDALTNYLTVTGYPAWASNASEESSVVERSAWPADVHVVGKDILRFHAIYWPAMLLAAGLPLPKTILAHSHWTMNRAKMSKSRGNVANPFEAIDMFGVDTLRFFLMRVGGNLGADSDYNPAVLVEYHRKYLQGQLGNLVSRISAPKIHAGLATSPRDEEGVLLRPSAEDVRAVLDEETYALCERLEEELKQLPGKVDELMQSFELAKVLELVLETAVARANEMVQRIEPWNAATPAAAVREAVVLTTETLRIAALLLHPFMPTKMTQLLDALLIPHNLRTSPKHLVRQDADGRLVSHARWRDPAQPKLEPLFPKIQPDPTSKA